MKRRVIIALTICALATAFIGCGSSITTVCVQKQTTELDTDDQTGLAKGISLYESGDYAQGEEALILAVKRDPTDWQTHQYLGLVRLELGFYRPAAENLFRSLDLAPNDGQARAGLYAALGKCWENLKNPGKARLHYHTALNLWPQCPQARSGLARLGFVSEVKSR